MSSDRTPGVLTLHFDPEGDLLEAARACEAALFAHWFGNTRAELDREFAAHEEDCAFVVLTDEHERVVAETRFIAPGPNGSKTLHDLAAPPWGVDAERAVRAVGLDPATTWDVATMGAIPGTGSGIRHALALYHGMIQVYRANDAQWGTSVLDQRARALMAGIGLHFSAFPGAAPAPYLGSPASVPVYTNIDVMLDVQRRTEPEAHRLVILGIGLDGVVVPPREQFDLAHVRASRGPGATPLRRAG